MPYVSVAIEGGLFPVDILDRVAAGDSNLLGQKATDFGIDGSRRITDETQSAFSDARSYWDAFQRRLERSHESRTTITREDWVSKFLELLGFENLVVQRSSAEVGSEKYFISHRSGDHQEAIPVHIVSFDQELDRRDGGRRSPHGLVQDYLNQSDSLWGITTNGRRLRLLRNIARISKPSYLEFDLEGMLTGNLYSEFVLLYRLLHITRFPKEGADANECLLEKYYQLGIDQGGRVREKLRDGVEEALRILGTAFLAHPQSEQLRRKFESKALVDPAYYRQLLHLVYRILFLMVAEERKLIFPIEEKAAERQFIYTRYYGITRLRERADRYFAGDQNVDLWLGLSHTFRILGDNDSAGKLGLSALNGELFSHQSCPDLEAAMCTNDALLKAIKELSTFQDERKLRRRVHYAGLDVEEFGSVYESLLDFHPQVSLQPPHFDLVSGSERKQTGSYYTPPELVHELIESALVPVIQDRLRNLKTPEEKEKALLGLRVCDPASGSGHFLLAAARCIARELGTIRSNGQEPSPAEYRHAIRDVIRTCVYAVDKNPLAIDLCKVALWMEGHSAGLPLSFLDHHIKCGDSLVGVADLKVLDEGIPDDAYKPVIGDDKQAATYYKKRNQAEKQSQRQLYLGESKPVGKIADSLADDFEALGTLEERSPDEVNAKEGLYNSLRRQDSDWWKLKTACDLWTAAFFMPLKQEDALHMEGVPTTGTIRRHLETNSAHLVLVGQAVATSQDNRFFHWALEFPDVFEHGGFDAVLGNPPWERVKLQEKEFFAIRDPEIAKAASKAERERLIKTLPVRNPALAAELEQAKHRSEAEMKFLRASGRFPLTAIGDLNTYVLFFEQFRMMLAPYGHAGAVLPTGIATDEPNKKFFSDLIQKQVLMKIAGLINEKQIFPSVLHNFKFCAMTIGGSAAIENEADFAFLCYDFEELRQPDRHFKLSREDLALLNPNTKTCPVFCTGFDCEITKEIYKRLPVIDNESTGENPWGISITSMFHMSNDSHLFLSSPQSNSLPLYEAKMLYQYDHRFASYESLDAGERMHMLPQTPLERHQDPTYKVRPSYYVSTEQVKQKLAARTNSEWLMCYRIISSSGLSRTTIASILPMAGVGNSIALIFVKPELSNLILCLFANLNSIPFDYLTRQKLGGSNLHSFVMKQLPIIPPDNYHKQDIEFITPRILELTYTAFDLQQFAHEYGYDGKPFRWEESRRFVIKSELDAYYAHRYGLTRHELHHILDPKDLHGKDFPTETFRVLRETELKQFGEYRSKRVVLEIYDEIAKAIRTGEPYQTRLDPPPADPRVAHPPEGR